MTHMTRMNMNCTSKVHRIPIYRARSKYSLTYNSHIHSHIIHNNTDFVNAKNYAS